MTGPERSRRRVWGRLLPVRVACIATVAVVLAGCAGTGAQSPPSATAAAASADPVPGPARSADPGVSAKSPIPDPTSTSALAVPAPSTRPVALRVPSIAVDAPMIELGLNPDRTLEVPSDTVNTGWYGLGPRPGELGPAVIVGHVDSKAGPGVFFRLRDLQPGASIEVAYDDGSIVTFTVTELARYDKDEFPTTRIYGDTPDAQLRLITCGGSFDRSEGHYRDNIIAFATRTPAG